MPETATISPNRHASGLAFAIGAYGLWGFLPAYFLLLAPTGPFEIVAWRIVLSLVFCAFLLAVTRTWRKFLTVFRDRRVNLTMGLAGALIVVNWTVYVVATLNGHVVEAALGYFTNPIVTVLLGVFVLRERLRPLQWVSIGISSLAVIVLAVNYGAFPIIALTLAFSFGLYGLIKKRVSDRVDSISGLTLETLWVSPLAAAFLIFLAATGTLVTGTAGGWHVFFVLCAGAVTAIPLLLFAAAAARVPLTYLGLTQYLAPIMQFLFGVFVLNEEMPPARLAGFALVWIALAVLTVDMFRANRAAKREKPSVSAL